MRKSAQESGSPGKPVTYESARCQDPVFLTSGAGGASLFPPSGHTSTAPLQGTGRAVACSVFQTKPFHFLFHGVSFGIVAGARQGRPQAAVRVALTGGRDAVESLHRKWKALPLAQTCAWAVISPAHVACPGQQ